MLILSATKEPSTYCGDLPRRKNESILNKTLKLNKQVHPRAAEQSFGEQAYNYPAGDVHSTIYSLHV